MKIEAEVRALGEGLAVPSYLCAGRGAVAFTPPSRQDDTDGYARKVMADLQ